MIATHESLNLKESNGVDDCNANQKNVARRVQLPQFTRHGRFYLENKINQRILQDREKTTLSDLVALLTDCANHRNLLKGIQLHGEIVSFGSDLIVGNALVNMYAKCGALWKAQNVFEELPRRDVVSWNVMISGYTQHGYSHEALECYERMQNQGLSPSGITFACILKACGNVGAYGKGIKIHADIVRRGLLEKDAVVGNALVDMYAKCSMLEKAQELFQKLPRWNVVSWNALISGYSQRGLGHQALECFKWMKHEGFSPDAITFICTLKACGIVCENIEGEEIHIKSVREGLLESNLILGNALLDMYARCGNFAKSKIIFDGLPLWDVTSWNALISGHAQYGHGHEALHLFEKMQQEGESPNAVTFICILKVCGCVGAADKGQEIHGEILRQGLLETSTILGTALVDMHAKCGRLSRAQALFSQLLFLDAVSWSALMAGYVQHGYAHEALTCFEQMQHNGFHPNVVTFTSVLKACSSICAWSKGEEIHKEVVKQDLLQNIELGNALVDMYAKCGALSEAHKVFEQLSAKNKVTWSALIAGYSQLGSIESVFNFLDKMVGEGVEPNSVTFVVAFNACSHTGLVDQAEIYFEVMVSRYYIEPTSEHHTCMVDLFSRAGHFYKALRVTERMPPSDLSDLIPLWSALLGACWKWENWKLGRITFEHVVEMNERDGGTYASMHNIYATASMKEKEVSCNEEM